MDVISTANIECRCTMAVGSSTPQTCFIIIVSVVCSFAQCPMVNHISTLNSEIDKHFGQYLNGQHGHEYA